MSKLLKKKELENAITDFIDSLRAEIQTLDDDLTFITPEDNEIKCRLYYTETVENNILCLKIFDSFCVRDDDLPRFFDFIDRVKEEYNSILK
jgi:hypothetical protein